MVSLVLWMFLPTSWDLGNVRALLALIINFLCVIGIWVVSYSAWKIGAMKLAHSNKRSTKLLSLYSPTGLGDVADIIPLLRGKMGLGILAQLLVSGTIIVILSAVAVVSAPIARYSTRLGEQVQQVPVPGTLASIWHSGMGSALVKWNATIERFKAAEMPLDQLVDFLPDNNINWKYSEAEWNNSWSASCQWTERTAIELYSMGNTSDTGNIFATIEGSQAVFPDKYFGKEYVYTNIDAGPYRNDVYPDTLLFILIQTNPNASLIDEVNNTYSNFLPFHFTIAAFHLKNAPLNLTDQGYFAWGTGPIEQSWYTMANCDIERAVSRTPNELDEYAEEHIAHPWSWDYGSTLDAYRSFYEAPLTEQSFRGESIYHPSGQDLFRFYQAYLATKDIQDYESAERVISVAVPTVELSVPVLVVFLLYLVLIALAAFWFVVVRRLPSGALVPRTKIEWMAQGMRESSAREVDASYLSARWRKIEAELREAEVVTVRDPAQAVYNTIQLGSQIRQQRSLESTLKA
ncbi:hypothetical protein B0T16DRAFT_452387 [Cercophora newfieldiana]|uniref:Uncharacterized protein n=1 Tax=Cercophora newfieldiana TaxID=92897 RepID=A0AA39YQN4_9PEZI|nr:hypothetical protein B0T16DRAFT_452387 [Cercophora newfieldiana]